jgi:PAS domain S-box-containing protein
MSANATKVEAVNQSVVCTPLDEAYELATILDSVLDTARALIAADAYAIWLLETSREEWRVAASHALSQDFTAQVRGGSDDMPATPVCAEDVEKLGLLSDRAPVYRREGVRSLMAVPIFIQGQRRGTVVFYFRSPHSFSKNETLIGQSLARLSSSALAATELYREQTLAKARSDFLSEASAVLASSLDYGQTLATVAKLAVPQIADWCAIDLVEGNELKRVAVAHQNQQKVEWVREIGRRYPQTLDSGTGLAKVIASARSELVPLVTDLMLERSARDSEHLAALRQLQMRSALVVPLLHRQETLGVITFVTSENGRTLTEQDRALAEALAGRAAVAIDNARLFTALEQSERSLRAVSETAACAIFIHDGTRVVYRNRVAADIIGMQQNETTAMWERVHPDDREMVKSRATARLRGEEAPSRYEFRILRPDGAVVWLDLSATAVEYGGVTCVLGTAFDVTERRFAVEQLKRREQEARALLNSLPDVISRFDRNLRHLYTSPQVERLTGIPASASLGKTFEEIGYPEHLCKLWSDSLRRVFNEGTSYSTEFSIEDLEGKTRYFIATGVPEITRDGVVESVIAISRDITEQRATVQELKASQTQLRLIIDSVPGLVAYVDTDERFRRVNRTFEEWFLQPPKSFLGKKVREVVGEENYRALAPRITQALAGQEVQFEVTNRYPDATRHVLVTYVPDVDETGGVCGFVALVLDVTERRNSEDTLRRTEKLAAAGRLAASIAHEINNPLESVTNLLYLLNQEPELSSAGREYLNLAEQELTRVSQIATQTLRFHRQSTRATSVHTGELLDAICALYRGRFDRLGITVEHRYRHTNPIQAFEGELRQLFANLIANALDAMPGGGRMFLRTRPAVGANGVRGVQVTVADTGQGIAQEMRGRIFEPFVTSKGMTGTGLGLWVSKEIVGKHGGSIHVRSRAEGPLHGTVFVVFLAENPSGTTTEG